MCHKQLDVLEWQIQSHGYNQRKVSLITGKFSTSEATQLESLLQDMFSSVLEEPFHKADGS